MTDGEEYIYPDWQKKDCVPYECANGHRYLVPPKSCLVCGNCEIFWDYTHGPYMTICGKNLDTEDKVFKGNCDKWIPTEREDTE